MLLCWLFKIKINCCSWSIGHHVYTWHITIFCLFVMLNEAVWLCHLFCEYTYACCDCEDYHPVVCLWPCIDILYGSVFSPRFSMFRIIPPLPSTVSQLLRSTWASSGCRGNINLCHSTWFDVWDCCFPWFRKQHWAITYTLTVSYLLIIYLTVISSYCMTVSRKQNSHRWSVSCMFTEALVKRLNLSDTVRWGWLTGMISLQHLECSKQWTYSKV